MVQRRHFATGFSGGEMAPGMFGLISDAEFRRGVERARNMIVLPQGGLRRRGGTRISAAIKDSAHKARVVRFRFSDDQAYAVELGHGYMRLHSNGAPVLALPRTYTVSQAVTFDSGADVCTWTGEHELATGQPVQFSGGTLPTAVGGNITAGVTYYAEFVNGAAIKLRRTPTGSAIDLTSNGSGVTGHALYEIGDVAVRKGRAALVDTGTETITSSNVHGLAAGDRVNFTVSGGTMVGGLAAGVDYYVIAAGLTAAEFRVSTSLGGSAVNLTSAGTGVTQWHFGLTAGVKNYYCIGQHINLKPNANPAQWTPMPTSGVLEIPAPFTDDNLFEVTFTQSNDVMTFAHRDFVSWELRRYSAARWYSAAAVLANTIASPTNVVATVTRGTSQDLTAITAVSGDLVFTTGTPHGLAQAVSTVMLIDGTAGSSSYLPKDVVYRVGTMPSPPATNFYLTKLNGGANLSTSDAPDTYTTKTLAIVEVNPATDMSTRYVVTAVTQEGVESLPSAAASASNNLDASGSKNTITWSAVTGARRYYVYREESGLFGFIGQVDADNPLSFIDDGINPDMSRTVPSFDQSLNGTEHPGAVGYYQGRRWFAATLNQPQDVWATRSGTEADLSYHIPVVDSDRIYFRVALREFAEVRHIVPAQHLVLLTSSGEVRVTSRSGDVLTPSGIDARPQSYVGASYVTPQVHGSWIVFAAERGGRVWASTFDLVGDAFIPFDLSVRAAHLFSGASIVDSALARSPHPVLWFANSAGRLLGCTFLPEQQVRGWFYFDTPGAIESVAAVPEGDEDRLYLVVLRNGVRYVERIEPVADATRSAGLFLDAAVTVTSGTVVTVPHPNGTSLDALVDGVVYRNLIVAGGTVTLPVAVVATAHVGLRYRSHVTTLPLALAVDSAGGQGRQMNISQAILRLRQSGSCQIGPSTTALVPLLRDDGATLVDGFEPQFALGQWANHGQLHIVQDDPLPLEVTSLTLVAEVGGP